MERATVLDNSAHCAKVVKSNASAVETAGRAAGLAALDERRRSESNRRVADLQSAALPLGHGAGKSKLPWPFWPFKLNGQTCQPIDGDFAARSRSAEPVILKVVHSSIGLAPMRL